MPYSYYILCYVIFYQSNKFLILKSIWFCSCLTYILTFTEESRESNTWGYQSHICHDYELCPWHVIPRVILWDKAAYFFHGVPWGWHLQWQMSSGIYGCSSLRKTPLTSHPPHLQRAWEKSRQAASTSTNTEEASPWGTSSREARDSNDQCSISRGAPLVSRTLALAIPVNDVIGLLGADDAECVDGGIRGCKMRVLARAPTKATFWTLTQLQELTHARYTAKWKTKVREHSFQNKFHHSPWLSLKGGKIKPKPLLSTTEHILNIINLWKGPLSPAILNAFLSEFCI